MFPLKKSKHFGIVPRGANRANGLVTGILISASNEMCTQYTCLRRYKPAGWVESKHTHVTPPPRYERDAPATH